MGKVLSLRFNDEEWSRLDSIRGDVDVSKFIKGKIFSSFSGDLAEVDDNSEEKKYSIEDIKLAIKGIDILTKMVENLAPQLEETFREITSEMVDSRTALGSEKSESHVLGASQLVSQNYVDTPTQKTVVFGSEVNNKDLNLRNAIERWYGKKIGKPDFEEWNDQGIMAIEQEYKSAIALGKTVEDYYVEEKVELTVEPVDLEALRKKSEFLESMQKTGVLVKAKDLKPLTKEDQLKWVGKKKK